MKFHEEEELDNLNNSSLAGTNQPDDDGLDLDDDEETDADEDLIDDEDSAVENGGVLDDETDTMQNPDNDLDEDELDSVFPGDEDPNKDSDLEDLNESV